MPSVSDPPATRHLLLVDATDRISRDEISIAKFDRVDVIYCSRETLPSVADKMKQFNIKWRSVNMLFHGSANVDEESICIFGIKMSMNRNIMMSDPNVQGLIDFTKAVCQFTDDSLYVYTCAVGVSDGLKELCLRLDKECNLKSGIFLSTNITGNGVGQDWNVEWGTKSGFLTSGVHTNEIEHATVALFRDIKKLTFTLTDEDIVVDEDILVDEQTYPMEAGQLRKWGYVVIKDHPCKIINLSTTKTGKHGHSKVHLVGNDIFTGKNYDDVITTTHVAYVPFVTKTDWTVVSIAGVNITCKDDVGNTEDFSLLPSLDPLGSSSSINAIIQSLNDNKPTTVNVLTAMGIRHIVGIVN